MQHFCPLCNRKFGRTDRVTLVSNQDGKTIEVGSDCGKLIEKSTEALKAQTGDMLTKWNGKFNY